MTKAIDVQRVASIELNITNDVLLEMYRRMVTIRMFEETVYDVYSRGIAASGRWKPGVECGQQPE